jgi:hypothetical protein
LSRRRALAAGWLLVLGLSTLLPLTAFFQGIIHVGPQTLTASGMMTKPVIALGSDVVLPDGSRSIVVTIGGNILLHGRARDDLVAASGEIYLFPHSVSDGDVLSVPGGIYQAGTARTYGRLGGALHRWNGQSPSHSRNVGGALQNTTRLGLAAGLALLLIGTCLTIVFPWQVVLIATTLRAAPLKSVGAGAISLTIFLFLVIPLGLSLAGLPFAVLLTGAASLAWLFGITACAVTIGRIVARGPVSLLWATAAGLIVVAVTLAVPLVGAVAVSVLGLAGAGALAVALLQRASPAAPML